MLLLKRSSPRAHRGYTFTQLVARRSASGLIQEGLFFGLVAEIDARQSSQTSALTGTVETPSDAAFLSGQGAQSVAVVGALTSSSTLDVGQGSQSVDGVILPTLNADIASAQGSQQSDVVGDVSPFLPIGPKGFWDGANVVTHPGQSLWQMNPRFQRGGVSRIQILGGVRPVIPGTPPIYGDGSALFEVANQLQFNPVPWSEEFDGIGFHLIRDTAAQVVKPAGVFDEIFGTANIYNASIDSSIEAAQGSQSSTIFILAEGSIEVGQGSQTSSMAASNGIGVDQTVYPSSVPEVGFVSSGAQIAHFTRYITGVGVTPDTTKIGSHAVAGSTDRVIFPEGIDSPTIFEPIIGIEPYQVIEMVTIDDETEFGDVTFEETASPPSGSTRFIKILGSSHLQFGSTRLNPVQLSITGISAAGFGTSWISNFIRYVDPAGINSARFGTLWISNFIRYLELDGFDGSIVWDDFGPIDLDGQRGRIYNVYGGATGVIGNIGVGVGSVGSPTLRINLC